jgi:hypothetical protein
MTRYKHRCPVRRQWLALIVTAGFLFLDGCQRCETRRVTGAPVTSTLGPSDVDLIQAVRRSVEGKTYEVTSTRQEEQRHVCSEFDVKLDPFMPRNPELAKCPRAGATYPIWTSVTVRETRKCELLPPPESGWHVQGIGEDRWRVTQAGSTWDVQRLRGEAAKPGDHVEVSSFSLRIDAHQKC